MTTSIYHITHTDNLRSIAESGLLCDREVAGGIPFHSIAHSEIKRIRAETEVPCGPGGNLDEYVPFYFAPRSPMLYTISRGNVASVTDGQSRIVHLVLSAEQLMAEQDCVFTNGHAIMQLSDFFTELDDLDELDWVAVNSLRWGSYHDSTDETKRKKQAEFLAQTAVPWDCVLAIGVPTAECANAVQDLLSDCAYVPPIQVRSDWYYQ